MSIVETITNAVDKVLHPKASAEDLGKETVPQLKARAKALGIKGFDGLKKAELIDAIIAGPGEESAEPEGEKSSPVKSDYASHPKFAKFNSSQGAE